VFASSIPGVPTPQPAERARPARPAAYEQSFNTATDVARTPGWPRASCCARPAWTPRIRATCAGWGVALLPLAARRRPERLQLRVVLPGSIWAACNCGWSRTRSCQSPRIPRCLSFLHDPLSEITASSPPGSPLARPERPQGSDVERWLGAGRARPPRRGRCGPAQDCSSAVGSKSAVLISPLVRES